MYWEKYAGMSVKKLMLKLEDDNWHTQTSLLEAIAQMDYDSVLELCKIFIEQDEVGYLNERLLNKRKEIDKTLRDGEPVKC